MLIADLLLFLRANERDVLLRGLTIVCADQACLTVLRAVLSGMAINRVVITTLFQWDPALAAFSEDSVGLTSEPVTMCGPAALRTLYDSDADQRFTRKEGEP